MSEKAYACVLHLLAPHFYRVYGEEARRLVRDRCRDERGVVSKIRLWLDLLADLLVAAICDDRFARQVLHSRIAAAHAMEAVPSFAVVRSGWPPTAALLVGGAFSLAILATLSALIDHGGGGQVVSPPLHGIVHFRTLREPHPTAVTSMNRTVHLERVCSEHLLSAPSLATHHSVSIMPA